VATVIYNNEKQGKLDWNDWSPEDIEPYPKSKLLAEKAAWKFVDDLPEGEKIPLVTIHPGFIIGPNLNEAHFSSGDVIKKMVTGEFPGLPRSSMPTVDVRECATAHLNALKTDKADGKRIFLVDKSYWFTELGGILN
jgi:nucleoside-diphosphate-sugar epimerase